LVGSFGVDDPGLDIPCPFDGAAVGFVTGGVSPGCLTVLIAEACVLTFIETGYNFF